VTLSTTNVMQMLTPLHLREKTQTNSEEYQLCGLKWMSCKDDKEYMVEISQ